MVLLNIGLTFAAAVMGITPVVTGAAVPKQRDSSLLARGTSDTSTWEKYHAVNGAFSRTGNCMSYIDPTTRDGTWACGVYCQNEATRICTGPINPPDSLINTNPNGERWVTGECQCNTAPVEIIAEATIDFVAKGLDAGFRELASVGCEVMMNVMKEAVLAGTYFIPGTGQVAMAARVIAKGVKLAAKSQGGKDLWEQAVQDSCNFRDEGLLAEIDRGFGIFEGAPDDF